MQTSHSALIHLRASQGIVLCDSQSSKRKSGSMNSRICLSLLFLIVVPICDAQNATPSIPPEEAAALQPYRNPRISVDARVADLLSRMTLEEKVGQLEIPLGWEMYKKAGENVEVSDQFKNMMQGPEPGTLYGISRADPWTKVTLKSGLSPRQSAEASNAVQKYAIEHSRLHIPLLLAEECPHGHMVNVDVSNTGARPGDEVAQIYLHPISSTVVTPTKSLRRFERIHLEAGQTRTLHFQLRPDDLAIFNQHGKWAIEPGTFELLAGGSSESAKLSTGFVISR